MTYASMACSYNYTVVLENFAWFCYFLRVGKRAQKLNNTLLLGHSFWLLRFWLASAVLEITIFFEYHYNRLKRNILFLQIFLALRYVTDVQTRKFSPFYTGVLINSQTEFQSTCIYAIDMDWVNPDYIQNGIGGWIYFEWGVNILK